MKNHNTRIPLKALIAAVFTVFIFTSSLKAQDGAKLFKQNCAVCHYSHKPDKITGPGLAGVMDRIQPGSMTKEKWLHDWIKDNTKMIKAGDPYAVKVFEANGKVPMTTFAQLEDGEIDALIKFIQGPAPVAAAPKTETTPGGGGITPEAVGGIEPMYLVLGVIVILAILLVALRSVRTSLQNTSNRAEGKEELPDLTFWQEVKNWISGHRRLVGVMSIIVIFIGMKGCWDACWNIGVYYDYKTQKGYHPEQPIKFSHKLHAGDNEIACQYCHNSVEKSRHAGIPTVNVCMNCHKGITTGPQYGEKEIAKIYQAAGFDPKTGTYDNSKQNPLKWIKVHNLPDHVYFNHSQHVVVGKIDCATCHGDVKSMTTVEQKAQLTMKWCVECHRQTPVAMEGNAYYDRLHKALKEKYAGQYDVKFTVEKIGGLECSKCHY